MGRADATCFASRWRLHVNPCLGHDEGNNSCEPLGIGPISHGAAGRDRVLALVSTPTKANLTPAVKFGLVVGIITGLFTLFADTNPAKIVANISVPVDNAVTITQEVKEFPLTREDLEPLRAWCCTEAPDHESC